MFFVCNFRNNEMWLPKSRWRFDRHLCIYMMFHTMSHHHSAGIYECPKVNNICSMVSTWECSVIISSQRNVFLHKEKPKKKKKKASPRSAHSSTLSHKQWQKWWIQQTTNRRTLYVELLLGWRVTRPILVLGEGNH